MNEDYYSLFGVAPTATPAEIKERFRFLSHAYHPDKFATAAQRETAEKDFKRINEAYQVLSDPAQRAHYDASRSKSSTPPRSPESGIPPPTPQTTKPKAKLLQGFLRLSVILFLSFWLIFICIVWKDALKSRNQYTLSQFSKYYCWPAPTGWLTEIAKPEFLSLSPEARQSAARDYFEKHMKELAREEFYDVETLEEWMVSTTTLTLEQAPIEESHPFTDDPSIIILYRNIPFDGMPVPQIWRVLLVKEALFMAVGAALVATLIIAGFFFVICWIASGFRTPHPNG